MATRYVFCTVGVSERVRVGQFEGVLLAVGRCMRECRGLALGSPDEVKRGQVVADSTW